MVRTVVEFGYVRLKTDLRDCFICGESIYSDVFAFAIKLDNKKIEYTGMNLCESCFGNRDRKMLNGPGEDEEDSEDVITKGVS